MSLIVDALRKAKNLATGSAPRRAPAYLKSFGFAEQKAPQNKVKKILISYVLPVVILGSVIAAAVMYWISSTAVSPMQEQAQLLEPAGGFPPLEDEPEVAPLEGEESPAMPAEGAREGDPATDESATNDPVDEPGGQEEPVAAESGMDTSSTASPESSRAETETREAPEPEPVAEQEEPAPNAPEATELPVEEVPEGESPDFGNAVDPPEPETGASARSLSAIRLLKDARRRIG